MQIIIIANYNFLMERDKENKILKHHKSEMKCRHYFKWTFEWIGQFTSVPFILLSNWACHMARQIHTITLKSVFWSSMNIECGVHVYNLENWSEIVVNFTPKKSILLQKNHIQTYIIFINFCNKMVLNSVSVVKW